jgi:predicted small metal-binding protein
MAPTKEEMQKLEMFKGIKLDRAQTEIILGRTLAGNEWRSLSRDYKKVFTPISKQAAKVARNRKILNPVSVGNTRKEQFKKVAEDAAKRGERRVRQKLKAADQDYEGVRRVFKHVKSDYKITKISQYNNQKYKTQMSNWKITGTVDIFEINSAIAELVQKMTENQPPNVKLQVSLSNTKNDRINQSQLLGCQIG